MLEQLARDVTGWNARVVEFFQLLATTQYMNHRRLVQPARAGRCATASRSTRVGSAFDSIPHTVDVRRIASGARPLQHPERRHLPVAARRLPAERVAGDARPADATGRRASASARSATTAALHPPEHRGRDHAPRRADQRAGADRPRRACTPRSALLLRRADRSLRVHFDAQRRCRAGVSHRASATCPMTARGWAHDAPAGTVAIDPVLGRLASPPTCALARPSLDVTYHYGAAGRHRRRRVRARRHHSSRRTGDARVACRTSSRRSRPPSSRSAAPASSRSPTAAATRRRSRVDVAAGRTIELRAADGRRPTIVLGGALHVARRRRSAASALNGLLDRRRRARVPGRRQRPAPACASRTAPWSRA